MKRLLLFLFSCVAISCSRPPSEKPNDFEFSGPEKLAEVTGKRISEASGIAASIANRGLLWTHNDSGNPAEVFLIDEKLNIRLTCRLKAIKNRDWEDITVGPGPEAGKNYVYVADIGDNMAQFDFKIIYRFEEPVVNDSAQDMEISKFDTILFKLEDRKKDTETLMIDPKTKDLYVVSKREEPVVVYTLPYPQSTTDTLTARSIATIATTQIVGGDFSADGKQILMKNYKNVFYWQVGDNQSIAEVLKKEPKILPYDPEPQGEAITFSRDGRSFYTISEIVKDEESFLSVYRKK